MARPARQTGRQLRGLWDTKASSVPPPCVEAGWPRTDFGYPNCDIGIIVDSTTVEQEEVLEVEEGGGGPRKSYRRKVYQYTCPPVPVPARVADISGIQRRPQYRYGTAEPTGVHSYYNLMWDGRVRRGDPSQKRVKKEEEECAKIRARLSLPRQTKPLSQRLAERLALKAAKCECDPVLRKEQEILRYGQLAIANLAPKETEKFFVDLSDEIDVLDTCYNGRRLQPLRDFPIAPSRAENLVDGSSQVWPNDFFDFDAEVIGVLEPLLGAVIERARWELLQEEELAALEAQEKNRLQRIKDVEEKKKQWEERERKRQEELDRLKKVKNDEPCDRGVFYNVCTMAGNLSQEGILECVEQLMDECEKDSLFRGLMEREMVPWLNTEVGKLLGTQGATYAILDEIIQEVVDTREAEFGEEMWQPKSKQEGQPQEQEDQVGYYDNNDQDYDPEDPYAYNNAPDSYDNYGTGGQDQGQWEDQDQTPQYFQQDQQQQPQEDEEEYL